MPETPIPSRRTVLAALSSLPVLSAASVAAAPSASAATPNISVDFTKAIVTTDPLGAGITISTFDGNGNGANINKSALWMSRLQELAPAHCRIPLRWNGGNPGSGAAFALSSGDADTYIKNIKAIGAIPYIVFVDDAGGNGIGGNGLSATDAAAFVHHYNDNGGQNNGPVKYWVIGNEPDNNDPTGSNAMTYTTALPGLLSAMHAADSAVKLSAPAAAQWNPALIKGAAGDAVDILSYHAYNGGDPAPPNGGGWPTTLPYYTNIKTMQGPGYKSGISYGVEEFNWHFDASTPGPFLDYHNGLFVADVIGHVLSAGGHATFFADSAGAMGLMDDGTVSSNSIIGNRLPAWWGIAMWTGINGTFPKWGAHFVPCTTTFAETSLTAYACDNGKIVVINKTASAITATISMKGKTSGTWYVYGWLYGATDPLSSLGHLGPDTYSNGTVTQVIPARCVASFHVS